MVKECRSASTKHHDGRYDLTIQKIHPATRGVSKLSSQIPKRSLSAAVVEISLIGTCCQDASSQTLDDIRKKGLFVTENHAFGTRQLFRHRRGCSVFVQSRQKVNIRPED